MEILANIGKYWQILANIDVQFISYTVRTWSSHSKTYQTFNFTLRKTHFIAKKLKGHFFWDTLYVFTHTPCRSMGQQMDILSFFSSTLQTFQATPVHVSLRYRKCRGGGGVGPWLCMLSCFSQNFTLKDPSNPLFLVWILKNCFSMSNFRMIWSLLTDLEFPKKWAN